MVPWLRAAVPLALIVVGVAAAGYAYCVRSDVAQLSIFIGVASTAIASGLVDLSALIERHRQLRPVRQLAARRVGRVHQLLIGIIQGLFDDLAVTRASEWPSALRGASDRSIDLSKPAQIFPPRSRAQYLNELVDELESTLTELRVLGAAGALSEDADLLDRLSSTTFIAVIRASVAYPLLATRKGFAADLATEIEEVQARLPAAAKAAGRTWIFGTLE